MLGKSIVICLGLISLAGPAHAENYPSKPITMTLAVGAGSPTDAFARAMARHLEKSLGQPVVVDNLPGAAGVIATRTLVRAPADGYTIGLISNGYVSHQFTSKRVQYRWPQDFELVHQSIAAPQVLLVSTKVPAKTLSEFLAYAKANPGKLNVGDPGSFTSAHISSQMFQLATGTEMTQVTYKTSVELTQALHTNEIQVAFLTAGAAPPGIQSGTWRILGVITDDRLPSLPDVPTLKEGGVNMSYKLWFGFAFPHGTPQSIVDRWYNEASAAVISPDVKAVLKKQNMFPIFGTREEMELSIEHEMAALQKLIVDAKLEKQ